MAEDSPGVTADPRQRDRRSAWFLASFAAVVAVAVTVAAAWVNLRYWECNPYYGDSAAYTYFLMRTGKRAELGGRFGEIAYELRRNARNPLQTVPFLAAAPEMFRHPNAHLVLRGLALFCFLGAALWTVYRRTGSRVYAACAGLLFLVPAGFLGPAQGFSSNYADLSAVLFAGAAACSLLNSDDFRRLRWVFLFAVFASATCLTRYVAVLWTLIMISPLFIGCAVNAWRRERAWRPALGRPLTVAGGTVGVLALPFLVAHLGANLGFYGTVGYDFGSVPVPQTAQWARHYFDAFYGEVGYGVLLAAAVSFWVLGTPRMKDHEGLGAATWLAASHVLALVFWVRLIDDPTCYLFAVPGIWLLCVAPVRLLPTPDPRRWVRVAFAALGILALGAFVRNQVLLVEDFRRGDSQGRAMKEFQWKLAQNLTAGGRAPVWSPFFAEWGVAPCVEAQVSFGQLPLYAGQRFFTHHRDLWRGEFKGMEIDGLKAYVYDLTCRWVEVAVVRADPQYRSFEFTNEISEEVARHMAQTVASDPAWVKEFELDGPFGPVAGYRNSRAPQGLYRQCLFGLEGYGQRP